MISFIIRVAGYQRGPFVLTLAQLVFAHFCLAGLFASDPLAKLSQVHSSMDLDIYVQEPDNTPAKETTAVTLFTATGELYKQGITIEGHWRVTDVAPAQYEIQVVAPGFERAVERVDADGSGEVKVDVQLRPLASEPGAYPPPSANPEVNYVFGLYASRLGDEEQAKTYWTKALEILPHYVPALVSMGEALLRENKTSEAVEYLDRAAKLDPSYWRAQAVLAEASLGNGSANEAIRHAERAMELGHEEAASVSPLLARSFAARAVEVFEAYLKSHPEDVAARKQLEGLNAPSKLHASEQPNTDLKDLAEATTPAKPAARTGDTRWLPPEVGENPPPVEPGTACDLNEVLEKGGKRIEEFVGNVDRFTATESLLHETIARSGNVFESEKRKYDYVVSITEVRPGVLDLREYESNGSTPDNLPGNVRTRGLPALVLIFHPYYSDTFAMKCEGLATWNGIRAWQIYFRQRQDKPNRIRAYRIGSDNYPVALKGRAWIAADSYQILGLQTDLIASLPEIRLTAEHTDIQYGPVHFTSRAVDMWLPQTAEVYTDFRGRRIHRRLTFSDYLLFAVDEKQRIATPKADP